MAEPLTVIRHRPNHEWRLENWAWRIGDPHTWTLHYLSASGKTSSYLRCADEHEEALLNECKRLVDDARGVKGPEQS